MRNKVLKKINVVLLIIIAITILTSAYILLFGTYKGDSPGSLNYPQNEVLMEVNL